MQPRKSRKRKKRRSVYDVFILLLFLSGVALIFSPLVDNWMQEREQNRVLREWLAQTPAIANAAKAMPAAQKTALPSAITEIDGIQVFGMLSIDAIDLKEVIVPGSGEQQLKQGIGIVEPDRLPGQNGNFVLAGHRSWTYGKHFSRLNELKAGDQIKIKTTRQEYTYAVTDSFLVLPDQVDVLNDSKQSLLTLITCEPAHNPTHRLIVKAQLVTH